jgi:hypothetical protein
MRVVHSKHKNQRNKWDVFWKRVPWAIVALWGFTFVYMFIQSLYACCGPESRFAAVSAGEPIRAAFAAFAADDLRNEYPSEAYITNYAQLKGMVERYGYGNTLPAQSPFDQFVHYSTAETERAGMRDDYSIRLGYWRDAEQRDMMEYVLIFPGGVLRCSDHKTDSCTN